MTSQTFVKYIDENTIQRPSRNLKRPDRIVFNFDKHEAALREEGYLPLVELNRPEDVADSDHYAKPHFSVHEDVVTETVDKVVTDEEGNETTVQEEVTRDLSYIECTYVAEEIPANEEGD